MEEAYCGTVGVEFTHIADLDQACVCLCACLWLYPQGRARVSAYMSRDVRLSIDLVSDDGSGVQSRPGRRSRA